jgi:multiple sugar transport system permease protein
MATRTLEPKIKRSESNLQWGRIAVYVVLTIGAFIAVAPFLYMITTSLKTYGSVITNNLWPWWPLGTEAIQWSNYPEAIKTIGVDRQGTQTLRSLQAALNFNPQDKAELALFFRYAFNSVFVTLATLSGVLFTSVLAAYAFAQMEIPLKNYLFILLLATIMIPGDLTLVPKAVMMFQWKWYNTYLALIVPFLTSVFSIFLLRQFFMQIPKDLFDAALIDGSGHLRYLFTIVIPLSKPALVSVGLMNFIWAWDSFKWPLLVTRDSSMRVLAVGLQQFLVGEGGTKVQLMMAFSAMVVLPVIVFYFFTQKYFTEGIATTGIKG